MKNKKKVVFSYLWVVLFGAIFLVGTAHAEPSKSHVIKMWENQYKNKVLDLKTRGGERTTNQLHNKHYITPIGTCWDYDVTEIQKCGCRLFDKASVCCRKGSSSDCEIRIGNSKLVDCSKFGKPKFGLSGDTEPEECRQRRMSTDCFNRKDLTFGIGNSVGPCQSSPSFICPNKEVTMREYWAKKCGPTPEDCGCTIVPECSKEENLKCYTEWKNNKDALDCYWSEKYKNNYERQKCYEGIKKRFK